MKKFNKWTLGLAAVGAVSLASAARADETPAPSPILTALTSTTLSGYVDTSAQWNLGSQTTSGHSGTVPGYGYNSLSKADGFNLNVIELSLDHPADAKDSWGAGYHVDALFGPDAVGFGDQSPGASASDFAVKQAYVDLKAPLGNGLDIKMGVFNTLLGYEVFESGSNPNFTRSYGYTIEPTTHTGVLLSYQFNDEIGVSGGVVDSFGPTINGRAQPVRPESFKTYTADISLTAPKNWGWVAGSTLYGAVITGFNPSALNTGVAADQTGFYAGSTLNTPLKELKVGISYDYEGASKQPNLGVPAVYANATAIYATWQATDKLSFNGRGEWFTQSHGLTGLENTANPGTATPAKVLALTGTIEYDMWKNVMSRLELRWDHQSNGGTGDYGIGANGTPGTRKNSYEAIANVIYKF